MVDTLSLLLRIPSFVLLLQAAGVALFIAVLGQRLTVSRGSIRRLGRATALVAIVFVTGQYLLEAARMSGELSGAFDLSMQRMALQSSAGAAFVARAVGLALIAASFGNGSGWTGLAGVALAVGSFALTGHTSVNPHHVLDAAFLIIHLLVVSFWVGSLWPLYLSSRREPAVSASRIVDGFSTLAVWLVPCIALAGLGLALALIPSLVVFSQPYGQLLLVKVGLYCLLMVLAGLNKWILGPSVADPLAARRFRRTVVIEYTLICAVLAATAVMTALYSPEPS